MYRVCFPKCVSPVDVGRMEANIVKLLIGLSYILKSHVTPAKLQRVTKNLAGSY